MVLYYSRMANTPVTSLRIPEDLKEWAQRQAQAESRSLGNWIVKLIQDKKASERKGKK